MSDLDSFFAKKDKKKVKGKKFTTTDEIARRLEETEKKLEHQHGIKTKLEALKKLEESSEDSPAEAQIPIRKEEEEWNDFKDDTERDLTDLKITKLQIEDEEDGGGGSADDDGEKGEHGDKKDGVWKTEQNQIAKPAPVAPPQMEPEEKAGRHLQGGSSYVPPHMRNMAASPLPKNTPRRSRVAPDINNEMAFPSLSDAQAANPVGAWGRKKHSGNDGFENVKHGSTNRLVQEDFAAPKLTMTNRFEALSEDS